MTHVVSADWSISTESVCRRNKQTGSDGKVTFEEYKVKDLWFDLNGALNLDKTLIWSQHNYILLKQTYPGLVCDAASLLFM